MNTTELKGNWNEQKGKLKTLCVILKQKINETDYSN
jgi:hypothetical protein